MPSHWPPAELTRPHNVPSRKYRNKWEACEWRPFMWWPQGGAMFPNEPGQAAARRTPAQPGIYEFAISRTLHSNTKHTVYVGMSKNLRARHSTYALNGSHLTDFMEYALSHGNVIWRRCLFLDTELRAKQEEMLCHTVLDYPWNRSQNPSRTRFVYTRKSSGLFGGKELVVRDAETGRGRVFDV